MTFDPGKIFRILDQRGVDYVVIGAMAAVLQGTGVAATVDLDVTPSSEEANRERLAAALRDLGARLRVGVDDEPIGIPLDARTLRGISMMTLVTTYGPFDILFEPRGAPPYDELRERATTISRFGVSFRVADVHDLVAMKRATGREKDAEHLRRLLDYLKERKPDA